MNWPSTSLPLAVAFLQAFILFVPPNARAAEAPPNDNFEARTVLSGTRVEFSGTLAGSTTEAGDPELFNPCCGRELGSVWYSWTAPETGAALIQEIDKVNTVNLGIARVHVSTAADIDSVSLPESFVTETPLSRKRYATFNATGGITYRLGIIGYEQEPSSFSMLIALTNFPIVLEGPSSQNVSPGGTAFFTVAPAADPRGSQTIQWQFDGQDLPGENGYILAFTNVTATLAGSYRAVVTVSDASGTLATRTSSPAQLTVGTPERPQLSIRKAASGGTISIETTGSPGWSYSISQSDKLDHFTPFAWISLGRPSQRQANMSRQFFRSAIWEPVNPVCHLNLQRLYFAKERLSADDKMNQGDALPVAYLNQYLSGVAITCPEGGIYSYSSIGSNPHCSLPGHSLTPQY